MKTIFILLFLSFAFFAQAQDRSMIGVSYGFGNGTIGTFGKSGSPFSNKQKSLNIFGLNYWHELGRNLFFETGLQLIRYDYEMRSHLPNAAPPTQNTLNIISAPFKLRFEAGSYIFFNGGLTVDISKSKPDPMSGIGAGIGIGLQFKIARQTSLYVNPQANIHSAFPSGRLFAQSNIAFGAAYRIPKP